MPVRGGAADKLGNEYEELWSIDRLLCVLREQAASLTLEPLDEATSRGIEFIVEFSDGTMEHWSAKRGPPADGWSLAALARPDQSGRSILGDLFTHAARSPQHRSVFASGGSAPALDELCEHARKNQLRERLERAAGLKRDFELRVLPECGQDLAKAEQLLARLELKMMNHRELEERVERDILATLCQPDGSAVDAKETRALLALALRDHLHQRLDRALLIDELAKHQRTVRDWSSDAPTRRRCDHLSETYIEDICSDLIDGTLLPLPGSEDILSPEGLSDGARLLVAGTAGAGKSSVLAQLVTALRTSSTPVLPLRMDELSGSLTTTVDLGRALGLPASPVVTLGYIARGKPCVLIIDQLDAISIVSGRRQDLWPLFRRLIEETRDHPTMTVVVGCRHFDLEHDHRLRKLRSRAFGFETVTLGALSHDQIRSALPNGAAPTDDLLGVLSLPLHLYMYKSLPEERRDGITQVATLFDEFWELKEQKLRARLDPSVDWIAAVDRLLDWLSGNQQLSAPAHVLDGHRAAASALCSEHVFSRAETGYRFFHETFFDYAFARRFASSNGTIVDFVCSDEQHLFRRAQVRQMLAYLRRSDPHRYRRELTLLLADERLRFHILSAVIAWLGDLDDPTEMDWGPVRALCDARRRFRHRVLSTVIGPNPRWFDVVHQSGYLEALLSSPDPRTRREVVHILSRDPVSTERAGPIASLIARLRGATADWLDDLRAYGSLARIHASPESFALFVDLVKNGVFGTVTSDSTLRGEFWMGVYGAASKRPDLASEALAVWFDLTIEAWKARSLDQDEGEPPERLRNMLDLPGGETYVWDVAAASSDVFASLFLPRVVEASRCTQAAVRDDRLPLDGIWGSRCYGSTHTASKTILQCLIGAMTQLAKDAPTRFEDLVTPYFSEEVDTVAFVVLTAWRAATPSGDPLAAYLAKDPRRLKVGYQMWGAGGGNPEVHTSVEAVRACSADCCDESFLDLESAICALADACEARHPQRRGRIQLRLLEALPAARLTGRGRSKLEELRTKFPNATQTPPRPFEFRAVPSPIPGGAQEKMSDNDWLRALRKHAGGRDRRRGEERALADDFRKQVKTAPLRFAALSLHGEFDERYLGDVLRGLADSRGEGALDGDAALELTANVIRHAHTCDDRPNGRDIAWLIQKWPDAPWPSDIVDIIAWYAHHDPDPAREMWREDAGRGQSYYSGDPYTAGINSVRGSCAETIGSLLFKAPERLEHLRPSVETLCADPSLAVRSCVVTPLIAMLNLDPDGAIELFKRTASRDETFLSTPRVEAFVHHASRLRYQLMRPVLQHMLEAQDEDVVELAATQTCVVALGNDDARSDAERVRKGTSSMRKAAATVYATNVRNAALAPTCLGALTSLLTDGDEKVRDAAMACLSHLDDLATGDQAGLLTAFLAGKPDAEGLDRAILHIEKLPVRMPNLVCTLLERALALSQPRSATWLHAPDLTVRLYVQSQDATIRGRCLDLIDRMEETSFGRVAETLSKVGR